MNLDIQNIASSSQQIWITIHEVIHETYFFKIELFPTEFLDYCKKKETNLKIYQVKSKLIFKNGFRTNIVCTSCYDTQKGVI